MHIITAKWILIDVRKLFIKKTRGNIYTTQKSEGYKYPQLSGVVAICYACTYSIYQLHKKLRIFISLTFLCSVHIYLQKRPLGQRKTPPANKLLCVIQVKVVINCDCQIYAYHPYRSPNIQNMSDLNFDISRSLKVKRDCQWTPHIWFPIDV